MRPTEAKEAPRSTKLDFRLRSISLSGRVGFCTKKKAPAMQMLFSSAQCQRQTGLEPAVSTLARSRVTNYATVAYVFPDAKNIILFPVSFVKQKIKQFYQNIIPMIQCIIPLAAGCICRATHSIVQIGIGRKDCSRVRVDVVTVFHSSYIKFHIIDLLSVIIVKIKLHPGR